MTGVLLVAAAAVAWSLGGLFFRAIDLDVWTISFWRSLFAAIFLGAYVLLTQRRTLLGVMQGDLRHGAVVTVGVAICMLTFLPALDLTSVANVALLYATAPILTALLGRILLRESLDTVTVVCATAVMVGGALLFVGSGAGPRLAGDVLALISTFSLVLAALAMRARKDSSLLVYVCFANVLIAAIAFPIAPSLAIDWGDAGMLMLFAFLQVALSFTLFSIGARMLPAKETALINAMEGPLSPLWVWLVFSEQPGSLTMVSGAIIMTAVFVHIAMSRNAV